MDYDSLVKNFDELNEQIKLAMKNMQDKSKGLIEAAANKFLNSCPDVKGVHWTQYTPYFNDGEACEFSVHDFCFHLDDDFEKYESSILYTEDDLKKARERLEDSMSYERDPVAWVDNYLRDYRFKYGRDYPYNRNNIKPYLSVSSAQEEIEEIEENISKYGHVADHIKKQFKEFTSVMNKIPEDIMKTVYGDHVFVVITREGTQIEDCDHD